MLLISKKEHLDIVAAYGLSDLYIRKGSLKTRENLPEVLNGEVVTILDATQDERNSIPGGR